MLAAAVIVRLQGVLTLSYLALRAFLGQIDRGSLIDPRYPHLRVLKLHILVLGILPVLLLRVPRTPPISLGSRRRVQFQYLFNRSVTH